jgi:malate synthase
MGQTATGKTVGTSPALEIRAEQPPEFQEILTQDACAFLARMAERFEDERQRLLAARQERQQRIREGELPNFLNETRDVRSSTWSVAPIPKDVLDRRIEITGPPERKMLINALNSDASVYMSDFEDSNSPT